MVAERIEEKVGEQYHMLRCRGLGGGPLASVLLLAIRKSLTRGVLRECWRQEVMAEEEWVRKWCVVPRDGRAAVGQM